MKKQYKKLLSLLMAAVTVLTVMPMAWADGTALSVTGGDTIIQNGVYEIAAGATGIITIDTGVDEITLIGKGATWDEDYAYTSTPFSNLHINCTGAPGITLTLQDVHIENRDDAAPVLNFSGTGNHLIWEGVNIIDNYGTGQGTNAAIHVKQGDELTMDGTGTLYLYKSSGGSGIGGKNGELNGDIIFDGGTYFIKGTKQGAVIGAGTGSASLPGTPGSVTFNGGEYNLISNSRGAVIGGSAGSTGGSSGTTVNFNGGSININIDYSGAAVGGGGFDGGNDARGGKAYFSGGSVRVYIDKNAANNTTWGGWSHGLNDSAITALRLNSPQEEDAVYKLAFDTTSLSTAAEGFVVLVDGNPYYTGGLHGYSFIQENLDKQTGEQLSITSTPSNWRANDDPCLYLYLTAEDHELTVNGENFDVTCDPSVIGTNQQYTTGPFTVSAHETGNPDALVWDGAIDTSWYNDTDTQFTLTRPAQLAGFAAIVNNKQEISEAGAVTGTDPTIPADDFAGKTVTLAADMDLGGIETSAGSLVGATYTAPVWTGMEWTPIASYTGSTPSANGAKGRPFKGIFDGGGHVISNIYVPGDPSKGYDSPLTNSHALFGDLGHDGIVKNVIIGSGYIRGARFTGGVVGRNWGQIESCANFATVETDGSRSGGGIAGVTYENTPGDGHTPWIKNSLNAGIIMMGDQYRPGGIVSDNEGIVDSCCNIGKGRHKTNGNIMAGIVGGGRATGTVINCYSLEGTDMPTAISGTTIPAGCDIKSEAEMKSPEFALTLGSGFNWAFALDTDPIYLLMDGMDLAGFPVPAVFATPIVSVLFETTPDNATVVVKHGEETVSPQSDGSYRLVKGETYAYTVSASGYVTKSGSFAAQEGTISLTLTAESGPGPGPQVKGDVNADIWDGYSIDVSWFDKAAYQSTRSYYIDTPAQLAGLAALVNGIYNEEIDAFAGDTSAIVDKTSSSEDSGGQGNNMSTDTYHYGAYDFNGKTVYLTADIDMSGGNYMPIGGQYLMKKNDSATKLGSSFCGVLDGQGHSITIKSDRHCSNGNYGDGQSIGLIGRLGVHDNDPASLRPSGAGVRNLAVYGSVKGNRSVGGIVGKIGKTSGGAFIENCANFASVSGTDAKGTGGIVGAAWNGGEIRNCYNAGKINNSHNAYGGIAGSNEIRLVNCYNIGAVTGAGTSAAVATENGGGSYVNCYWLAGTADMGVYNVTTGGVVMKTAAEMKSEDFLGTLGSAFAKDTQNINKGYPVLAWQSSGAPTGTGTTSSVTVESATTVSGGKATTTVTGAAVTAGIEAAAGAGEKTLVIKADAGGKEAASTTVSIPKASVQEISNAALNLTVQAADGSRVTLAPETMASLTGQATGSTLEINVTSETKQAAADIISSADSLDGEDVDMDNSLVVSVTVKSDGKAITGFSGSMAIDLPADGAKYTVGETYKVYQISADGSVEVITGTCVKVDGVVYVRLSVSHLSSFVVTQEKTEGFDDVKPGAWYHDAVAYVTEKGLMNGTGDKIFSPNSNMTRAMLMTVLYRLEGKPAVTGANSFTDVASGQWYTDAVIWADANKIVDGYGNGLFGTNDSVTRQQMAAILYRYAQYKGYDMTKAADLSAYTDAAVIADWALAGMKWAGAEGLITGRTASTLAPGGAATRGEVATILMRFCETFIK